MISSAFTLKDSVSNPISLSTDITRLEENYYLNSSLDFLLECHKETLDAKASFYKTVLEAEDLNPYVINEATSEVITKIKTIIKKILAYIESICERFITKIAKFVSSDRYIIKKKDAIKKFKDEDKFTINGFVYTFDGNIPIVDIVDLNLSELQSILTDTDDNVISKAAKIAELNSRLSSINKMDDIRAQILNLENPVPETSFNNETYCVFRDGNSEEIALTVDRKEVLRALNDFTQYKDKIRVAKNTKVYIDKKYRELETQVNNLEKNAINLDGSEKYNYASKDMKDLKYLINKVIETQVNQIQRIANLHVQAFASKLDALDAAIIQDRSILYLALSKVQSHIENTRIMKESVITDYTRDNSYRSYIVDKYYTNLNQKHFVEECLALSESNIRELKAINEELKIDINGKYPKLVEILKTIYSKFLAKMDELTVDGGKFLENNKATILTKQVDPPYTINNFPDYEAGIKNIKAHKLISLNIKSMLSDSETDIQKKVLPAYNGDGDFTDFAKNYFLCGNKPNTEKVSSATLDMKEIYGFCATAKETVKVLENDRNSFSLEANKIKSAVLNSLNESKNILGSKYYYSTVLESYINEDGETTSIQPASAASGEAKGSTTQSNTKIDLKVSNSDVENKSSNDNNAKEVKSEKDKPNIKAQQDENKDSDRKKVEETADWYLKALKVVCTAKITAFQKIYSEYMKIIRYHVSQFNKDQGSQFSEEEVNNITNAMKEYKNAKTDEEKKAATDKIINIYKSKNINIDAHGVSSLVNKNAEKL